MQLRECVNVPVVPLGHPQIVIIMNATDTHRHFLNENDNENMCYGHCSMSERNKAGERERDPHRFMLDFVFEFTIKHQNKDADSFRLDEQIRWKL